MRTNKHCVEDDVLETGAAKEAKSYQCRTLIVGVYCVKGKPVSTSQIFWKACFVADEPSDKHELSSCWMPPTPKMYTYYSLCLSWTSEQYDDNNEVLMCWINVPMHRWDFMCTPVVFKAISYLYYELIWELSTCLPLFYGVHEEKLQLSSHTFLVVNGHRGDTLNTCRWCGHFHKPIRISVACCCWQRCVHGFLVGQTGGHSVAMRTGIFFIGPRGIFSVPRFFWFFVYGFWRFVLQLPTDGCIVGRHCFLMSNFLLPLAGFQKNVRNADSTQ